MNVHGLQVSSSSLRDIIRLERSLQHLAKKEEAKFALAIACFVLVFKMQSVFSRCGFLSAAVSLEHIGISYLWKLSANSSKCFTANGKPNYDTIGSIIKHPTPRMAKNLFMLYFNPYALGAPASDDLSVFEKKEDMLFFHSI